MSFILDALKKSEHKRRAEGGQEPRTIFEPPASGPPRWRRLLVLLLVALLLGILILLGILVFRQPQPIPIAGVAAGSEVASAAPALQTPERPAQPEESVEVRVLLPRPVVQEEPPVEIMVPALPSGGVTENDQVYLISELPANVRGRLPALQMAMHAYNAADPAAGMVQINGRLLRAGTQLAENLTVEEITPDGAILRSGAYRFLLSRRGQ